MGSPVSHVSRGDATRRRAAWIAAGTVGVAILGVAIRREGPAAGAADTRTTDEREPAGARSTARPPAPPPAHPAGMAPRAAEPATHEHGIQGLEALASEPPPVAAALSGAPPPGVRLAGILGSARAGAALFEVDAGDGQHLVHVGGRVPGTAAVLDGIERDAVLVAVDGHRERWVLGVDADADPSASSARRRAPERGTAAAPIHRSADGSEVTIAREHFDDQVADLPKLLGQARLVPRQRDGRLAGFEVVRVAPGSPFAALGLEPGDVLLEIDGVPLDGLDRIPLLLADLEKRDGVRATLERAGVTREVQVTIR